MVEYTDYEQIREVLTPLTKYKSKINGIYRISSVDRSSMESFLILFITCHNFVYKITLTMKATGGMLMASCTRNFIVQTIPREDFPAHLLALSDKTKHGDKKLVPIYDGQIPGGVFTTGKDIKENALFGGMSLIEDDTEVLLLEDVCIVISDDASYKGFYYKPEAFNIESL